MSDDMIEDVRAEVHQQRALVPFILLPLLAFNLPEME